MGDVDFNSAISYFSNKFKTIDSDKLPDNNELKQSFLINTESFYIDETTFTKSLIIKTFVDYFNNHHLIDGYCEIGGNYKNWILFRIKKEIKKEKNIYVIERMVHPSMFASEVPTLAYDLCFETNDLAVKYLIDKDFEKKNNNMYIGELGFARIKELKIIK